MTPTLEAIIFSSQTVSLNFNELSKPLSKSDLMFNTEALNGTVAFKCPNFDTVDDSAVVIPGLLDISSASGREAVKTAIFIPKNRDDLTMGGFGVFLDDEQAEKLMQRHVGIDANAKKSQEDMAILTALRRIPSLDPFIVKETFDLNSITVNPAYLGITDAETTKIRSVIATKVEPIVAKAIDDPSLKGVAGKVDEFLDAIWDPSATAAGLFIKAFGIKQEEAPQIFSAWKGIAFYYNEFTKSQSRLAKVLSWLASDSSLPREYRLLAPGERERIRMFRTAVETKIRKVFSNVGAIFRIYDESHSQFIEYNDPTKFRAFLQNADQYYWKLGACNGVLAQVSITWDRYNPQSSGNQFNFETLDRLFKICDSILSSRGEGIGGSGALK